MRYTINLTTRTYLDHRFINKLAYSAITLLLLLLGWNVSRVATMVGEQGRLKSEIAAIDAKLNARPGGISESDFNRQKNRIRFYNEIIERKSTNWLNILDLIENATPEGVALSALTPGKNSGEWNLEGNARSFKVVQQYLESLESSKNFSDVQLLSHKSISSNASTRGIQFSVTCRMLNR